MYTGSIPVLASKIPSSNFKKPVPADHKAQVWDRVVGACSAKCRPESARTTGLASEAGQRLSGCDFSESAMSKLKEQDGLIAPATPLEVEADQL